MCCTAVGVVCTAVGVVFCFFNPFFALGFAVAFDTDSVCFCVRSSAVDDVSAFWFRFFVFVC